MTQQPVVTPELAAAYADLQALASSAATDTEAQGIADQLRALARRVRTHRWERYPWQHPHVHPPGWVSQRAPGKAVCDQRCLDLPTVTLTAHQVWLQRGGRGTGKTEGAAFYINRHAEGPPCDHRVPGGHRFTIVAPTQADAVSACVEGVSGLKALNPGIVVTTNREGTTARWPNGAVAKLVGGHTEKDVDRLRAWSNICGAWVEEAAAIPRLGEVLDQLPYTLRLGVTPHTVITTTPKNRPEVVALIDGTGHETIRRATVETWGRTRDAHRLPAPVRTALEDKFGGTTAGRQELDGDLLGDVEGALWVMRRPDLVDGLPNPDERPGIDNDRVPADSVGGWTPHDTVPNRFGIPLPPPAPEHPTIRLERRVVGVDPAGGATETGISVVGTAQGHGYVLADLTLKAGPDHWGKVAVLAYLDFGAEGIALERTYGGDQTEHVIATAAEALGVPMPPLLRAPTVEGKKERALPLVALSQQHRWHNVGIHPKLEGEQTTWVEDETPESPNRLDAMVHAGRHLMVRAKPASVSRPTGRIR